MTSTSSKSFYLKGLAASFVAASLPLTSASCAFANGDRASVHLNNFAAGDNLRALRQEARQLRHESRADRINGPVSDPSSATTTIPSHTRFNGQANRPQQAHIKTPSHTNSVSTLIERGNTAVLYPGQVSTFHTKRPAGSTYINDAGNTKNLTRGVSLDFSSTNANITVGESLLSGSTTIDIGGTSKTITSGSKVTAAEFAALNQKLATGSQSLSLSRDGAADGGSINLNLLSDDGATIKASQLVIPKNVTVTGDFARTADGVRVTKDVVNYGSLIATSSNANTNTAIIGARDINNESGASIASQSTTTNPGLNLSVRADRDLNNDGSISSAGNLDISAGRYINNHGLLSATTGDVTFSAPADGALFVNNTGGTVSATNGAINVRSANFNGTTDSNVYGGNFYSHELNLNAGQGTANLTANEVTGTVNTKGLAAHVNTNTSNLILGTQCLTGDPTYYNTGNIVIGGAMFVGEDLAIIAGGDITTNQPNFVMNTTDGTGQGHNINIIAGANITSTATQVTNPLPAQSVGNFTGNANGLVTIDGASASGGNVDFTAATSQINIDGISAPNKNGANVTIAAFAAANGSNGSVLLRSDAQINAGGGGTGNNGNITIIAGNKTVTAMTLGSISTNNGSGTAANTGVVTISNTQPISSDGKAITFDTTGAITTGNSLIPSNVLAAGSISAGAIKAVDVRITAGGALVLSGAVDTKTFVATAKADVSLGGSVSAKGGELVIVTAGSIINTGPVLLSTGANNIKSGNITLVSGANFSETANNINIIGSSTITSNINLGSSGLSTSGFSEAGGDCTVVAFADANGLGGHVTTGNGAIFTQGAATFANGDLTVVGGAVGGSAVSIGDNGTSSILTSGGLNGTGAVDIAASTPVTNIDISKTDGTTSSSFLNPNALTAGAIQISNEIRTDANVSVRTNGNLQIASVTSGFKGNGTAGDITLHSGTAANFSAGQIRAQGNNGDGGDVLIDAGSGTYSLNSIFTDTSGSGDAGSVILNTNTSTPLALPFVISTSSPNGDAGDITVRNFGVGGIDLNSISIARSTAGNAGDLVIDAKSGAISKTGDLSLSANAAGVGFSDGLISLSGSTINVTGNLILAANTGALGTGFVQIITTSGISVPGGTVQIAASASVLVELGGNNFKSGAAAAGTFNILAKNALNINAQLDTTPTAIGGAGGSVILSAGSGLTTGGITVKAIKTDGNGSGTGGAVQLTAGSNGISVLGGISSNSTGVKGDVTLTAANGPITVGGVVANNLQVNFNGASSHNATMGNSAVNILKVAGNGSFSLDNGASPLTIGANISGALDLMLSTTDSTTGISNSNTINVTGDVTLNTPKLTNTGTISAASVTLTSTGNLDIDGGASGVITGTFPPAGAPGSPSTPTAIRINTGSGSNLNLFGKMTFNGDVFINNPNGTTTSKLNSTYTGNNNIQLITNTYTQETNGTLTANKLIFLGTSIINSDGAVNLTSDAIFNGKDLIIAAKGNVNLGNFVINTSSNTGDGGNVTIIAGFDMTPSSGGQQQTQTPFTLNSASTGGGSITITGLGSVNTSSSSATGNAGNITAVSSGGSITLGNLTATSLNGNGGDVLLIGPGITAGNIDTRGATSDGSATLLSSNAQNLGPITLQAGSVTGSVFAGTGANPGPINVGAIVVRNNGILLDGNSTQVVTVGGALTANAITIFAGALTLTSTDTILVLPDGAGNGGSINVVANNANIAGPTLKLIAMGTGAGAGGDISYSSKSSLLVDSNGDVTIDASGPGAGGHVTVQSEGNLTVANSGLNASGTSGDGSHITLQAGVNTGIGTLTLLDTSFLDSANAKVSGNGGFITLTGQSINISGNTATNPLSLSANGINTGDGGKIEFSAFGPDVPVFIGTPAKLPKSGIFLDDLSAQSGLNGGNGGIVSVIAGGNLTVVDTAKIKAAPLATGDFNGAQISLTAGEGGGKSGSLAITGNLNGDAAGNGNGGQIVLKSNNKKAFVVDSIKAARNGTLGTLSATGVGGLIVVTNDGGGVTVAGNGATNADGVTLEAGGKGAIAAGSGITITSNNVLSMSSDLGAVGKKGLAVDAPFLQLFSNSGSINVFDNTSGLVTLLDAHAGGDFSLTSAGNLTVSTNFSTDQGSIALIVNSGLLTIGNNQITANNGSLTLASLDVTNALGGISIAGGATIETQQQGGQVVIAIGQPPSKGTGATSLAGFNVTATPKNFAFFGADTSGIVSGGTVNVNANLKNVIFNNLSTSGQAIFVGNGAQITADPPLRTPPVSTPINVIPTEQTSITSVIPNTIPTVSFDSSVIATNNANLLTGNVSTISDITKSRTASQNGSGISDTSRSTNTTDLIIDAGFVSSGNGMIDDHIDGNVLYAPTCDTTIETKHGTVNLAAGSIAVIMQSENSLAVYDLHDGGRNQVVIQTGGKRINLSPGRHITISSNASEDFASVNAIELVQHRSLDQSKLNNGWNAYASEFSIPSACYAVKPLKRLMTSSDRESKKMANRIAKTTAVLMTLRPDHGDFVQHFKPAIAAMSR